MLGEDGEGVALEAAAKVAVTFTLAVTVASVRGLAVESSDHFTK